MQRESSASLERRHPAAHDRSERRTSMIPPKGRMLAVSNDMITARAGGPHPSSESSYTDTRVSSQQDTMKIPLPGGASPSNIVNAVPRRVIVAAAIVAGVALIIHLIPDPSDQHEHLAARLRQALDARPFRTLEGRLSASSRWRTFAPNASVKEDLAVRTAALKLLL